MGKYTNVTRLDKKQQTELFIDFVKSLGALKDSVEAANYIKDLLSEAEVMILARRLQIARFLSEGLTYKEIHNETKASFTTIAKVHWWFQQYGDGYRAVISRTKTKKGKNGYLSLGQMKRSFPLYFWPQILLKEIVKSANKKERERLIAVIKKLKEKNQLSKELERMLMLNSNTGKKLQ